MIRERVNAGFAQAKAGGKRRGPPSSTPSWKSASGRLWLRLGAQEFTSLPSSLALVAGRSSALPGRDKALPSHRLYEPVWPKNSAITPGLCVLGRLS
jgi:hypothetical protein